MNSCCTERDKSRVSFRAFLSKITGAGTYTNTCSVYILLWVPNAVPTLIKLLRIFEVPISGTLLGVSQYMGTLNSVHSLENRVRLIIKQRLFDDNELILDLNKS